MGAKQLAQARARPAMTMQSKELDAVSVDYRKLNCSICWEHVNDTNTVMCNSTYAICGDDIERIFQIWIKNPSTHRPQCFQTELNLRECVRFLSERTLDAYFDRIRELAEAGGRAEGAARGEEEDEKFVKEAAEKGELQKCPRCKRRIQLTEGCIHMSCVCGEQFCYRCGRVWDRCRGRHVRLGGFGNAGQIGRDVPALGVHRRLEDCRHPASAWQRLSEDVTVDCCTHPRRKLRCSLCTLTACRNCKYLLYPVD